MFIPALLIGSLLLMAGGAGKKRRRPTPEPLPVREPTPEEAEAITYCEMEGGTASVMQTPEGEMYFICSWPDGRMVEAAAYHRGEAVPECPVEMMYDPTTMTCVPIEGPVCPPGSEWSEVDGACVAIGAPWPPPVDDSNFEICMGAILAAWAPLAPDTYNLAPAVANNVFIMMLQALEEEWEGYNTPEVLADFGMVHVAPECDWVALQEYVKNYQDQVGMTPGTPEDMARLNEVYASVVSLAWDAFASAGNGGLTWVPTEPPPPIIPGVGPDPDAGLDPDVGGVFLNCPPNYFYDALHGVCCPDGFFWDVEDQMCRPSKHSRDPHGFAGRRGRADAIRHGYAGGCGRRGHCGVRAR